MLSEDKAIFKGYLRSLIRQFKALKKAVDNNDCDEAKRLINELIEDTQKNIED